MKPGKYIIYLLAAIAAPLWIILGRNEKKEVNPITIDFNIDTAKYLIWKDKISGNNDINLTTKANINRSHLDSLFMFLSKSVVQTNLINNKNNEQLQMSLKNLIEISITNAQLIQALLLKDSGLQRSNRQVNKNETAKENSQSNIIDTILKVYNLKKNVPFSIWHINYDSVKGKKVFFLLNNTSSTHSVIINKIEPVLDRNESKNTNIIIMPLLTAVLNEFDRIPVRQFYIYGKFEDRKNHFLQRDANRQFTILVLIQ